MFTKKERGFTLIELMIVVAIIGILAAVAIPKFADLIDKAKEASAKSNIGAIRSAITIYYGSMEGLAPASAGGTNLAQALVSDGENMNRLPKTEIPYFVDSSGSKQTAKTVTANATTISVAYGDRGTGQTSYTNAQFAYDPANVELWFETIYEDTSGNPIHEW
jgi:type IV pilus assembly protein PilA